VENCAECTKKHTTPRKKTSNRETKIKKMNTVFPLQMPSNHKPMAYIGEASAYIPHRE
jgi:hypothetical protein